MSDPDRIVAVSTFDEPPSAVERFLERNLASGLDHLIVFLDADQPRVHDMLSRHPRVTVVRTAEDYWGTERPDTISPRLRINANVANAALVGLTSVRWLFYIDCDEALSFDRDRLLALDHEAVLFPTLEAVSQATWRTPDATLFKRRPGPRKLALLTALGSIDQPGLNFYYRGHHEGKPGVRPDLRVRFSSHDVRTAAGGEILDIPSPSDMHLLHYESWCLDDFVERWKGYNTRLAAGHTHRDRRRTLGSAFHLLYTLDSMKPRERRKRVRQFYDRNIADDLAALRDLDLVATVPDRSYSPRPLPDTEIAALEATLAAMRACPKAPLERDGGLDVALSELELVAARLAPEHGASADRLRDAIEHARISPAPESLTVAHAESN